jgi:hypothetical protein
MRKLVVLVVSVVFLCSCGTKKHTNCDAYGNKSGSIEIEQKLNG